MPDDFCCPGCEALAIGSEEPQRVEFLHGNSKHETSVLVSVWKCPKCGFAWTNGDAEKDRTAAVDAAIAALIAEGQELRASFDAATARTKALTADDLKRLSR